MTPWDKKHSVIAKAAKEIFIENGYADSSMEAIAKRAGVSKVTVYNHFENKEDLFGQIMVEHCNSIVPTEPLIVFDLQKSPRDILLGFCTRFIDILLRPDSISLMRRIIGEVDRFPQLAESIWKTGMPLFNVFCNYLEAEIEVGRLIIDDKTIATRQLFGMIKENTVYPIWFGFKPLLPEHKDKMIAYTVDMFLGFYARNAGLEGSALRGITSL